MKYSNVIAQVIGLAWMQFTKTIMISGLPIYPMFAAFPSPAVVMIPSPPWPFVSVTQVPVGISCNALKAQMIGQLGDPKAPFHKELFESIAFAFEQCYNIWKASTTVMLTANGTVPTMMTPIPAPGPVVGMAQMLPGGLK
jgi:hypothetical protein